MTERRLRLRPFMKKDADTVLSWCRDEREFYLWTAGVMGEYPLTVDAFCAFVEKSMAFIMLDDKKPVGFFTMRNQTERVSILRMGFVIMDPASRGKGIGKEMMQIALSYAKTIYKAKEVRLAVFKDNDKAFHCYKNAGFYVLPERESYVIMGKEKECIRMEAVLSGID